MGSSKLIAVIALVYQPMIQAEVNPTPLRTYAASPYQSTSLATQLRSAFPVESVEVFTMFSVASIWAHSEEFSLDYYQNQAFVGTQWRVSEKFSAELMYQFSRAKDNGLDSFVMSFHDAFGVGQNGRDEVAEDQFTINSDTYGISKQGFEDEVFVNALHLNLQYHLYSSKTEAFSIGGTLYFNDVKDSSFSSASFEQGIDINYSKRKGSHALFSTLGVTHRKDEMVLNSIETRNTTGAFAVGYSYQIAERHHILSEYHIYQGGGDDNSAFSKASQEVILGYRYRYQQIALELSGTENIGNMDNSTDILFSIGIRFFLKQ